MVGKWESFILSIKRDGAWGGHVTLMAAAELYDLEVRVITSFEDETGPVVPSGRHTTHLKKVDLAFLAEHHYDAV